MAKNNLKAYELFIEQVINTENGFAKARFNLDCIQRNNLYSENYKTFLDYFESCWLKKIVSPSKLLQKYVDNLIISQLLEELNNA